MVYIADVLDEVGEAEASRLQADGLDLTYLHLDTSDEDSWKSAVKTIKVERGRLDVLVNNAGIIHVTPIAEEDLTCARLVRAGPDQFDIPVEIRLFRSPDCHNYAADQLWSLLNRRG